MAQKKKKPTTPVIPLSPEKYILTRARLLPIDKCLITADWQDAGMATVIVTRRHVNGHITAGIYLVDLLAYGVKDTHFIFNTPEGDFREQLNTYIEVAITEISYPLAHNIIYGSVAFAEEFGFKPHKDFVITENVLEEDTEAIELMDIPFGIDGKAVLTDEAEDEEMNDEIIDGNTYDEWTDEEWRNFFESGEEISTESFPMIMEALFQKWLREHENIAGENLTGTNSSVFTLTNEPMQYYNKNEAERQALEDIFYRLQDAEPGDIPDIENDLRVMITQNPNNPIYHNYLYTCATILQDDTKTMAIAKNTVKEFPDYLIGKLALANLLIQENNLDETAALFNNTFHLEGLYPGRREIHYTEYIAFHATMIRYFLRKDNLRMANEYAHLVYEIDLDEHPDTSNIFDLAEEEFVLRKIAVSKKYIEEHYLDPEDIPANMP